MVPARLDMRTGWPSLTRLTIWPMRICRLTSGLVAERLRHRHQAADIAVVVGAEHDDVCVEAALALVEVVAEVARDVGGLAVGADDDAVAVVAELGGAQPDGAVLLEDVAQLAEALDGALDRARLVQVVLVEVHVEVDAEARAGSP